jgi:tetratricopeptide (TPR) repeat protein
MFIAAYCSTALGRFEAARATLDRAQDLIDRLGVPMFALLESKARLALAVGEVDDDLAGTFERIAAAPHPAAIWGLGWIYGDCAAFAVSQDRPGDALRFLELLVPWLEQSPAWAIAFPIMAHSAAEVLWLLARTDHLDVVEAALREKVVEPDFRSPMSDGRLALGRCCALAGRWAEATSWFAAARRVLTEQGARPLLAIADYDEALMYVRRGEPGDAALARPLLDAARRQFEAIGMVGWLRRADELAGALG